MRILVTYGSKRGGTAEIAEHIAEVLRERGLDVACRRADDVTDLELYDTVIIGGALYMARWPREVRRFVARHADALRARRVWMFSSGPLDTSASEYDLPVTKSVARLMARVGARGHVTFGGRLAPDARGFFASVMAERLAGDWRDWPRVRAWASSIADAASEPFAIAAPEPRVHWSLVALCAFVAITALGGGIILMLAPSLVHADPATLAASPFTSFFVPGLLLAGVIGLGHLAAAIALARRTPNASVVAFGAGVALLVFIATEVVMLRVFSPLQLLFAVVALVLIGGELAPARRRFLRSFS